MYGIVDNITKANELKQSYINTGRAIADEIKLYNHSNGKVFLFIDNALYTTEKGIAMKTKILAVATGGGFIIN